MMKTRETQAAPVFGGPGRRFDPVPPETGPDRIDLDRRRGQVVDRLALAGRRHARHFVDQLSSGKPIGRHIVVFFYSEPARPRADGVRVATRMFLDDAEVADLATILERLHDLSVQYSESGELHPPSQLANGVEEMSREAEYIGLGVSTLFAAHGDGSAGRGPRGAAINYADIPFEGAAYLIDGTQLRVRFAGGVRPVDIQSTHPLDTIVMSTRRWTRVPSGFLDRDSRTAAVSRGLSDLHSVIPRRSLVLRQRRGSATRTSRPGSGR